MFLLDFVECQNPGVKSSVSRVLAGCQRPLQAFLWLARPAYLLPYSRDSNKDRKDFGYRNQIALGSSLYHTYQLSDLRQAIKPRLLGEFRNDYIQRHLAQQVSNNYFSPFTFHLKSNNSFLILSTPFPCRKKGGEGNSAIT